MVEMYKNCIVHNNKMSVEATFPILAAWIRMYIYINLPNLKLGLEALNN